MQIWVILNVIKEGNPEAGSHFKALTGTNSGSEISLNVLKSNPENYSHNERDSQSKITEQDFVMNNYESESSERVQENVSRFQETKWTRILDTAEAGLFN